MRRNGAARARCARVLACLSSVQHDTGDRHTRPRRCVPKIYRLETQSRLDGYLYCRQHDCNVLSYLNNYGPVNDVRSPPTRLRLAFHSLSTRFRLAFDSSAARCFLRQTRFLLPRDPSFRLLACLSYFPSRSPPLISRSESRFLYARSFPDSREPIERPKYRSWAR